jgi:hypothetical protein
VSNQKSFHPQYPRYGKEGSKPEGIFNYANAPAAFQHFMNDIFRDLLDVYIIVYLGDLLIFSKSSEEHEKHVQEVLRWLAKHGLYCNLKMHIWVPEFDYLGLIVSGSGTRVDLAKVETTSEWPTPKNVKNI